MCNWGDSRLPDRFWSKVVPEPNSGCWLWIGGTSTEYGKIRDFVGRKVFAHRLAFEVLVAPVPRGLFLDHRSCQTPICCNPAHLDVVTQRTNVLRGNAPAARQARQSVCKRGHALTADNIYNSRSGTRRKCKTCDRERVRRL